MKNWWRILVDYFIPDALRDDLEAIRRTRLMLGLSLLGVFLGGTYGVFYWNIGHSWGTGIIVACILVIVAVPYVIRFTGNISLAGNLCLIVWAVGFTGLAATEGGVHGHAVSWLACGGPLLALLILDRQAALVWCGICVAIVALFGALDLAHVQVALRYPAQWHSRLMAASISGFVIFMSLIGIFFEHARKQALLSMQAAVAERMRTEHARATMEEANRSKDQFLAMLSHELRTPLTPVLAILTSFEGRERLPPQVLADVEMIQRNVELEAQLIDDLLDVTRISTGKIVLHFTSVDTHSCLRSALEICRRDFDAKELQVALELDAVEYHVKADLLRLRQVFWNLLRNALKFTPPNGRLIVRTSNDAGRLIIQFIDTGIGIEPELLPTIFNLFEQGDGTESRRVGGLGLGLAIAKGIVEMHHGNITAFSAGRNQGAKFTLDFPTTVPGPDPPIRTKPAFTSNQRPRILLVEDNTDTLRILSRLLHRAGYPVATATSVQEAWERIDAGNIDLVISDLGLPDGSGLDLMRGIKMGYGLPGIALSGFGTQEDILLSREAGFEQHLVKPVAFTELRAAIEKLEAA